MGRGRIFRFKQFTVTHERSALPLGTDGVLLGAWCNIGEADSVLDVGTGCGIISLMMAQRNSNILIDAIDIDQNSVLEASENFAQSPWGDRITCHECDFNQWEGHYDLIVSNPPFFLNGIRSPQDARARARHTQSLSFEQFMRHGKSLLGDDGRIAMISPYDIVGHIIELATFSSLNIARMCEVVPIEGKSPKRVMWELSMRLQPLKKEQLILKDTTGNPTPQYKALCSDFYLHF